MRRCHAFAAVAAAALGLLAFPGAGPASAGVEKVEGGYRFSYTDPAPRTVSVAGAFNGWNTTANPLSREGDTWSVVVQLPPGKHEYKFVVDGQWTADPDNPMTSGAYGNSLVTIAADGSIGAVAGDLTFNTRYSPKVLMGGRFIGRYIAEENHDMGDRFELRRPEMDVDLDFKVTMSEFMDARLLSKIRNEQENVELWQSHLYFDRGAIRLHAPRAGVTLFDNEGLARFDDPLRLVGDVGIYRHAFGYGLQGMQATSRISGTDVELLYTDNSAVGGTSFPTFTIEDEIALLEGILFDFDPVAQQFVFLPSDVSVWRHFTTNGNENVAAARLTRQFGRLRVGASGRYDRGYDPGALASLRAGGPVSDTLAVFDVFYKTTTEWDAVGLDLAYETPARWRLAGEVLQGRSRVRAENGQEYMLALSTTIAGEDTLLSSTTTEEGDTGGRTFPLDESLRFFLGASRGSKDDPFRLDVSTRYESHDMEPLATTAGKALENSSWCWAADADWATGKRLGASWTLGTGLEYTDFTYDPDTPFGAQLWLDRNNFWLDNGEHVVTIDRILMLGGNDVVSWRPRVAARFLRGDRMRVEYDGVVNAVGFDRKPKYLETNLRGVFQAAEKMRVGLDTRLVRYDDPRLGIRDSFHSLFAEIAYLFTDRIEVSLSYGVDPWVLDTPVNEYARVGRDYFLYDNGLNAAVARDNALGLQQAVPEAEQALQDEHRIQVEAIVRF